MIVKLQKPLFPAHSDAGVLAYDQRRTFMTTIPLSRALDKLFGSQVKIYCEAEKDDAGRLVIGQRVSDRAW